MSLPLLCPYLSRSSIVVCLTIVQFVGRKLAVTFILRLRRHVRHYLRPVNLFARGVDSTMTPFERHYAHRGFVSRQLGLRI